MTPLETGVPFADGSARTRTRGGFLRVVSWSFVAEAGGQLATLVVGIVLAAVLGPATYGVVAMAMAYVLLVELIQRQGIVAALIQRRDLDEAHVNAAFWMVIVASIGMTGLSVLLAGWWAAVNGVPLLAPVVVALSALLPLKALTVVQEALLRRRLSFRKVALRTFVSVALGGVVGIVWAVLHPTVWAFVAQQLVSAVVAVVLLWAVTKWRPRLQFSAPAARELLGFSTGSFLTSLGAFVHNRADVILIGFFFGPYVVGIYALCARIADAVIGLAVRPLQAVALPELSAFQVRLGEFRERLRRLDRMAALLGLTALGVVAATAEPLFDLLGPSWSHASVLLQLLVVAAAVRVVTGLNGPFLQALGRPHLTAVVTWATAAVSAGAICAGGVLLARTVQSDQLVGLGLIRVLSVGGVGLFVHVILQRALLGLSPTASFMRCVPGVMSGIAAAASGTVGYEVLGMNRLPPLAQVAAVAALALVGGAAGALCLDAGLRSWVYRACLHGNRDARHLVIREGNE